MMNKKLLIILVVIIVALFGLYKFWESNQFRVVGTTPSMSSSVATSTSVIKIDFSHDLSDEQTYDRTIIEEGQSLVREVELRDKSLYVRIFEIFDGETYSISFKDIQSSEGKIIKDFGLTFKARYIPSDQLSQAQKDLENSETDRFEAEDPVLEHIPHSTIGYTLEPVHSTNEEGSYALVINMKISLSNADRGFEEQAVEAMKNQAFEYLRSKEINPEDYEFNYIVRYPAY